jgi:hypothetical protein
MKPISRCFVYWFCLSCARILQDGNSNHQYSVIVVGGETDAGITNSVELLDEDSDEWHYGTSSSLPVPILSAALVEYAGGALLIGGQLEDGTLLNTIYHLANAEATWTLLPMTLSVPRSGLTAFLVDDPFCT